MAAELRGVAPTKIKFGDLVGILPRISREDPPDTPHHYEDPVHKKPFELSPTSADYIDEPRVLVQVSVIADLAPVLTKLLKQGISDVVCYRDQVSELEKLVVTDETWLDYEAAYRIYLKKLEEWTYSQGTDAKTGMPVNDPRRYPDSPQSIMAESGAGWRGKLRYVKVIGEYDRAPSPQLKARQDREAQHGVMEKLTELLSQLTPERQAEALVKALKASKN